MRVLRRQGRQGAKRWIAAAAAAAGVVTLSAGLHQAAQAATSLPRPSHVVVVVFENHSYGQVLGGSDAPYFRKLARNGADLTKFYAETHPSQPNYFAMFSGSTQGVTGDECPPAGAPFATPNLARELIAAKRSWRSYNEGLPSAGSKACTSGAGKYARKHNPWFSFSNVPASTGRTFGEFPKDFAKLPTVSFVVPNLCNDMHDCSVATGDTWLKDHLGAYARWTKAHNSLLIVTFDEDNWLSGNKITTVVYGAHVKTGAYSKQYNHYNLLRTIEDMYGTGHAGQAAKSAPITGIWN